METWARKPNRDFMDARVASDFVQKDIICRETPASVDNHLALVESSELWSDTTKHKQLMVEFFQQMRFFGVSIARSLCNYKSVTVPETVRTFTGPLKKKKKRQHSMPNCRRLLRWGIWKVLHAATHTDLHRSQTTNTLIHLTTFLNWVVTATTCPPSALENVIWNRHNMLFFFLSA